jgi:hypothetical protein
MEQCPYKIKDWKRNLPANLVLVGILAAIALLYYLYFHQEKRIFDYEQALKLEGGCK